MSQTSAHTVLLPFPPLTLPLASSARFWKRQVALRVCPAVLVWCCICFVLIISDLRHGFIDYKADVDKVSL